LTLQHLLIQLHPLFLSEVIYFAVSFDRNNGIWRIHTFLQEMTNITPLFL
jgi:hypothetical protein